MESELKRRAREREERLMPHIQGYNRVWFTGAGERSVQSRPIEDERPPNPNTNSDVGRRGGRAVCQR